MRRFLFLLALAVSPAVSKVQVVYRFASPPLPVEAGQQFALCAANVGQMPANIELQFVSVRTGAVIARREVVLPPPGAGAAMPDPCLVTDAETVSAAGPGKGEPPLVVGLMIVRRGVFARASAATASVQVTGPALGSAERRLLASIPLILATLSNRNTPIEVVR